MMWIQMAFVMSWKRRVVSIAKPVITVLAQRSMTAHVIIQIMALHVTVIAFWIPIMTEYAIKMRLRVAKTLLHVTMMILQQTLDTVTML